MDIKKIISLGIAVFITASPLIAFADPTATPVDSKPGKKVERTVPPTVHEQEKASEDAKVKAEVEKAKAVRVQSSLVGVQVQSRLDTFKSQTDYYKSEAEKTGSVIKVFRMLAQDIQLLSEQANAPTATDDNNDTEQQIKDAVTKLLEDIRAIEDESVNPYRVFPVLGSSKSSMDGFTVDDSFLTGNQKDFLHNSKTGNFLKWFLPEGVSPNIAVKNVYNPISGQILQVGKIKRSNENSITKMKYDLQEVAVKNSSNLLKMYMDMNITEDDLKLLSAFEGMKVEIDLDNTDAFNDEKVKEYSTALNTLISSVYGKEESIAILTELIEGFKQIVGQIWDRISGKTVEENFKKIEADKMIDMFVEFEALIRMHKRFKESMLLSVGLEFEDKEMLEYKGYLKYPLGNDKEQADKIRVAFDFMERITAAYKSKEDQALLAADNTSIKGNTNPDSIVNVDNDTKDIDLSPQLAAGIAMSALYKPLLDNAYANPYIKIVLSENDEDFKRFHTSQGRLVKHLLISNESNAVTKYVTYKQARGLRTALLKDLIENTHREKLLFTADDYYNAEDLEVSIDSYEEFQKKQEDQPKKEKAKDLVPFAFQGTKRMTNYNTWKKSGFVINRDTVYIAESALELFEGKIKEDNYKRMNSMNGVKQAKRIRETPELLDAFINNSKEPIFMSSRTSNKSTSLASSYMNYVLLHAIEENLTSNYKHVLDLDAPIFVDIYGNIITESGLVVIPAAANGTNKDKYNILTVAFATNVEMFEFPVERWDLKNSIYTDLSSWYKDSQSVDVIKEVGENTGVFKVNPVKLNADTASVTLSELNLSDMAGNRIIYKLNKFLNKDSQAINTPRYMVSLMYPVTKGAVPEMIDYVREGIEGFTQVTKVGLRQALKLENFIDSAESISQNVLFATPDIRFNPHYAWLFYVMIRVLVLAVTVLVLLEIYFYAVRFKFNPSFFFHLILSVGAIVSIMFLFPILYSKSYDYSKVFMQDSLIRIAAINQERAKSEMEIGVIDGRDPTAGNSKLLLKLGESKVSFKDLIPSMVENGDIKEQDSLFNEAQANSRFIESEEFEKYGNMHFIDVQKLFDASIIDTDLKTGLMHQYIKDESKQSYYLPYFMIIDYIIRNVNDFNYLSKENTSAFMISKDGTYRSIGRTTRYFRSNAFLVTAKDMRNKNFKLPDEVNEDVVNLARMDKAGVHQLYGNKAIDSREIELFKQQLEAYKQSAWYREDLEGSEVLLKHADKLDREAVKFMVMNSAMIGRVSDETIIKALALHLSLKYNDIFDNGCPTSIELNKVSTHDIVRTFVTTARKSIILSSYSYSNFIYKVSGIMGVVITFHLELLTKALSVVKALLLVEISLLFILSLLFHRLISRSKTNELIKGYIKTSTIVIVANFMFAMFINLTTSLTITGMAPVIALMYMNVICILYLYVLIYTMFVCVTNISDMGNSKYNTILKESLLKVKVTPSDAVQKVEIVKNNLKSLPKTGWEYYEKLRRK